MSNIFNFATTTLPILSKVNEDGLDMTGLWLSLVGLLLVAVLIPLFDKSSIKFNTKSLVYGAVMLALSFGLSYVRLWRNPQGGSLTLFSALPILLYSYMFGTKKGVIVGILYGLLQAIQDPYIVHPIQFFLDYPVAFSMLGLAGMFRYVKFSKKEYIPKVYDENASTARIFLIKLWNFLARFIREAFPFALGSLIVCFLRYLTHVFTGVFAFSLYATGNLWVYSFTYNLTCFFDVLLAIVVGCILFFNNSFVKLLKKNGEAPTKKKYAVEGVEQDTAIEEAETSDE